MEKGKMKKGDQMKMEGEKGKGRVKPIEMERKERVERKGGDKKGRKRSKRKGGDIKGMGDREMKG